VTLLACPHTRRSIEIVAQTVPKKHHAHSTPMLSSKVSMYPNIREMIRFSSFIRCQMLFVICLIRGRSE